MRGQIETSSVRAYYLAALRALAFVEQRHPSGRRFGADADARWSSFRGDLETADRIDLIIRDADAQWPAAFGARTVFDRGAVAEDEPFGAEWPSLDPVDAAELWRDTYAEAAPTSVEAALLAAASAWKLTPERIDLTPIEPADKLVVAGPGAIITLALAFEGQTDLDWAEQVLVVATHPAHRQLAALGGALLNATKATRFATADTTPLVARLLHSPDASEADAARAQELMTA